MGFVGVNCSVRTELVTTDLGTGIEPLEEIRQIVEGCGKIEQMKDYATPVEVLIKKLHRNGTRQGQLMVKLDLIKELIYERLGELLYLLPLMVK